jgi:hypothetical protein
MFPDKTTGKKYSAKTLPDARGSKTTRCVSTSVYSWHDRHHTSCRKHRQNLVLNYVHRMKNEWTSIGDGAVGWDTALQTGWRVPGSTADGIIAIFHWHNPSGRTMSLGSTQPLTEMSKRKAVPLQAWSGQEGSTKLRFPDYITTAQDGGKVVSRSHRPPLPTRNALPATHFC